MAFDHNIVAIDLQAGAYSVIASATFNSTSEVDWIGIGAARVWHDVRSDAGYQDDAMILSRDQLRPFMRGPAAVRFIDETAPNAFLFLVHRGEWESGT